MDIINTIKKSFNNKIEVKEKRPDIYQIYVPIFHEDGDMVDIYLEVKGDLFFLCDYGKTLQRLSYEYDIDTTNKEQIFQKILAENNLIEQDGNIFMPTSTKTVFTDILHVTHVYTKVGSMKYFKREVIESLFVEMLTDYIFSELNEFAPEQNVKPIPQSPEYEVDYSFKPNGHHVYLMGIKHSSQAKLATINFQAFKLANMNFRGWVVYDSFDKLSKPDITIVSNASEKQFTTLDVFKKDVRYYLEKERH